MAGHRLERPPLTETDGDETMMDNPGDGDAGETKEADFKKSRRARNEQANSEKGVANFGDASKADCACVNTPGCSSGSQSLNKDTRSWPGTCCPITRGVFH